MWTVIILLQVSALNSNEALILSVSRVLDVRNTEIQNANTFWYNLCFFSSTSIKYNYYFVFYNGHSRHMYSMRNTTHTTTVTIPCIFPSYSYIPTDYFYCHYCMFLQYALSCFNRNNVLSSCKKWIFLSHRFICELKVLNMQLFAYCLNWSKDHTPFSINIPATFP